MSEYKEIYVTQTTQEGGNLQAGNAYLLSQEVADKLIEGGKAEAISFTGIDSIKQEADAIADNYKKQLDELKTSPRFVDNEAERRYQIEQLEQETAFKIAEHDRSIQAELQAIRIDAASKALSPVGTPEEVATAKQEVDAIVTQVLIASNPSDVYGLLELKLNTMNPAEKVETLKRFAEIKARASTNDKTVLERIESGLRTIDNEHLRALRHVKALEHSGVSASQKYKTAKLVQQHAKGGDIV